MMTQILIIMFCLAFGQCELHADNTVLVRGTVSVQLVGQSVIYDYMRELTYIPEALVRFTSTATGETYSTVTDSSGHYVIDIPIENVEVNDRNLSLFSLHQNYPNPFNPATTIQFNLEKNADVSLKIYNVSGQLVSSLINEWLPEGTHTVQWNGTDDRGRGVSAGIYLYRVQSGKFSESRKMLMIDGVTGVHSASMPSFHIATASKKSDSSTDMYMEYEVTVEKAGYEPSTANIRIIVNEEFNYSFTLKQLDYFPLEVGNSWTFRPLSDHDDSLYTYTIVGTKIVNGRTYYIFDSFPLFIKSRPDPHVYPNEVLVRQDEGGLIRIWEGTTDVTVYVFFLTKPNSLKLSSIFESFEMEYYFSREVPTRLISVTDTIAGLHPCYNFISWWDNCADTGAYYWFAPSIGPIKIEVHSYARKEYKLINAHIGGIEYAF